MSESELFRRVADLFEQPDPCRGTRALALLCTACDDEPSIVEEVERLLR